jgi:hypothetical protein
MLRLLGALEEGESGPKRAVRKPLAKLTRKYLQRLLWLLLPLALCFIYTGNTINRYLAVARSSSASW